MTTKILCPECKKVVAEISFPAMGEGSLIFEVEVDLTGYCTSCKDVMVEKQVTIMVARDPW